MPVPTPEVSTDVAIEDLFPDREGWLAALREVEAALAAGEHGPARLADAAATLAELEALDTLTRRVTRLSVWSRLQRSLRGRLPEALDDLARVQRLAPRLARRQALADDRLARLGDAAWRVWRTVAPGLARHAGHRDALRAGRRHRLPRAAEALLAALDGGQRSGWSDHRRITEGDLRFAPARDRDGRDHPFTLARHESHFETSGDATLRRSAWQACADGVAPHQHAFAALYAGEVGRQCTLARLRRHPHVIDSLLSAQRLPREAYEAQRTALRDALPPVMRRFARLKQRWLGLPSIALHDLRGNPPEADVVVGYPAATRVVRQAVRRFDAATADLVDQAIDGRWVDHADRPDRPAGGGCATTYGPHPYVTLHWGARPRHAFLLAHELGHLVHFHRASERQPAATAYAPRYLIEAPSTFFELLLADRLLEGTTGSARAAVLLELLHSLFHNFVTHHLEAEFQDRVYRLAWDGGDLGAERLAALKHEVVTGFWGDAVAPEPRAGLAWMRPHHYYMGLYPSTYAAGQTIALLFHARWRAGELAAGAWLDWQDQGTSRPPLALLEPLGIDPRRAETHLAAVRRIARLVDELDRLTSAPPADTPSPHPLLERHDD